MRRLAACLILSLALAAPAAAQQRRIPVASPATDTAALRGPVSAGQSRFADVEPAEEAPAPAVPFGSAALVVPAPDARQCRMTCSRDYYFCLAGEDDRCPQHWSRCVTGCSG
ncbi:MAG: hypothetical protein Q8L23_16905 [Caulobacter sp.]|nr:hypothetical protein [Caulobacter sp.]